VGEITGEMRQRYGYKADWIPAELLPRLPQDEVLDRLDEAEALYKKFEASPHEFAVGYLDRAQQICKAAPRDEVEQAAQRWLEKAEQAYTPQHAAGCMEQARLVRLANPSATRRDRTPPPVQTPHSVALAALKADIAAAVDEVLRPGMERMEKLVAGVAQVKTQVAVLEKAAGPQLTGLQSPDLTK
jgi:hypothetical protein